MRWTDVTLIAGLLIILAGFVLMVRHLGRRRRWAREQARPRSTGYVEDLDDMVSRAAVFGGLALVQLGNVAKHISERTLPSDLWLSLASSTAALLAFGILLGRLHMRWQLRRILAGFDAESGEIGTHS